MTEQLSMEWINNVFDQLKYLPRTDTSGNPILNYYDRYLPVWEPASKNMTVASHCFKTIERFHRSEYELLFAPGHDSPELEEHHFADAKMEALLLDHQRAIMDSYDAAILACLTPSPPAIRPLSGNPATHFTIDDPWVHADFAEIEKRIIAHGIVMGSVWGAEKSASEGRQLPAVPTANRHERRAAAKKDKRRGQRQPSQHNDQHESAGLLRADRRGQHEHTRRAHYQPGNPPRRGV